jgi:hypothetical protein
MIADKIQTNFGCFFFLGRNITRVLKYLKMTAEFAFKQSLKNVKFDFFKAFSEGKLVSI